MRRMKKTIAFGIGLVLIAGMARLSMAQDGVAAYLVMIGNQGTQIANQVQQIQTMRNQITQSIASLQQYRDAALGQIGAIIAPIRDLMAVPSDLLDQARDWQDDFTGTAGEMAGTLNDFRDGASLTDGWRDILAAADTVREADIRATYAADPEAADRAVAAFGARRAVADRRIVLANTRADAAASVVEVVTDAEDKIDGIAAENNVSTTALGQAILAGTLTEGQLIAAMAELEAWDASTQAAADYDAEVRRRELEAEHQRVRTALAAEWAADRAALEASRPERLETLYGGFRLHPFFGGEND